MITRNKYEKLTHVLKTEEDIEQFGDIEKAKFDKTNFDALE